MTDSSAALAGRREWLGLAVLSLACLLATMDLTILWLALPEIAAALGASATEQLWISDIYGFLIAASLITMGTLGDRVGRRRVLVWGALAFGAFSVLAAVPTSPEMLIVARGLLGVAGAALAPATPSLLTAMSTWHAAFLVAVPVMLLILVCGPRLLPEVRDASAGRLELRSAALSLAAVLLVIYGIKEAARDGLGGLPAPAIVAGLALGAVFVRRQRTLADPLVDLRIFRSREFSGALGTNAAAATAGFGIQFLSFAHVQNELGLSPLETGLWMLPASIAVIVSGMASAPRLVARLTPAQILAGALTIAAAGVVLMGVGSLASIMAGGVLMNLAFGTSFSVTMTVVVSDGIAASAFVGGALLLALAATALAVLRGVPAAAPAH